jgi:hypothetical protein
MRQRNQPNSGVYFYPGLGPVPRCMEERPPPGLIHPPDTCHGRGVAPLSDVVYVCVCVPGQGENVWCLVGAGDVKHVVTDC